MLQMSIDAGQAYQDLLDLGKDIGLNLSSMVVEQSRLTAQGLMNRTPPLDGKLRLSRKAGRAAITSDLRKIFGTEKYFKDRGYIVVKSADKIVIRNPNSKRKAITILPDRVARDWDTSRMNSHHQAQRSNKTGRVMGGSAADLAMLKNDTQFNRYRKTVYARMGQLAKGWFPSLAYFAARSKISKGMRVPPFVAQAPAHGGKPPVDRTWDHDNPSAILRNVWRFGYGVKALRLYEQVLRERELDAAKWMRKRLSRLVNRRQAA